MARAIRLAAGVPDLPVADRAHRLLLLAAQIAERFRDGNVFLVGDAAHRVTPRGGTGMNTAIHDGHDLGWKLAWVLTRLGRAGAARQLRARAPAGRGAQRRAVGRPARIGAPARPRSCASTSAGGSTTSGSPGPGASRRSTCSGRADAAHRPRRRALAHGRRDRWARRRRSRCTRSTSSPPARSASVAAARCSCDRTASPRCGGRRPAALAEALALATKQSPTSARPVEPRRAARRGRDGAASRGSRIRRMPDALYFTDDPAACTLLATDPFALLVGFAIDQQVPVQKAFAGPLVLKQRVGTLAPRSSRSSTSRTRSASARRSTASPARWPAASASSPRSWPRSTAATRHGSGARRRTPTTCARASARCPATAR